MIHAARTTTLPATFRPVTMASGIRMNAMREPGKTALIHEDRRLTFAQLVDRIDRVSAMAVGLGLLHGDRAAIVSGNCLEFIEIVDGLAEAGIAVATPNPRQTALELGYILNDCGAHQRLCLG
jgi:long-chain acyl-CoA synthetase